MRAELQAGWPRCARLVAVALVLASAVGLGPPAASGEERRADGPPDSFVVNWDAVGTQAFSASGLTGADGFPIFAYVSIAVYDSVVAIEGGYEPFAVDLDPPAAASAQAAAAAAAHRVLVHHLPAQAATILDPALTASLATIPDGQAKVDCVATGVQAADRLIAQRAGDGFRAPVSYTPPVPPIPGVWLPTAPTRTSAAISG